MFIWKKKHVTIVALALLVIIAGYINWTHVGEVHDASPATAEYDELAERKEEELLGGTELVNAPAETDDYFLKARLEREEGHSRSIETLNEIIQNEGTDEGSRTAAVAQVSAIAQNSDTEVKVENLIKAKGYEDAVVYISDTSIQVVVKNDA